MKNVGHMMARASTVALTIAMSAFSAQAADYTAFSREELAAMRGTMWETTNEDREAFRAEWHNRISSMNTEERRQYMGSWNMGLRDDTGMGPGNGGDVHGMRRGMGGGMRHGRNR